jgi:hypothetical protein
MSAVVSLQDLHAREAGQVGVSRLPTLARRPHPEIDMRRDDKEAERRATMVAFTHSSTGTEIIEADEE